MSITLVARVTVGDYAKFEETFANRENERVEVGLEVKPYRNMDDPTSVVIIGTVPSKEAFVAFFSTPEQQDAMKEATIQGPPDFTFLEG